MTLIVLKKIALYVLESNKYDEGLKIGLKNSYTEEEIKSAIDRIYDKYAEHDFASFYKIWKEIDENE